jgi:transcriptional regulator with XRE-family HTH domain
MNSFGAYLKELRKSRRLSLKQVEAKAGVSNAYLSQLERGLRKPPHPEILQRLAKAYEVPVEDLLREAGFLANDSGKGITHEKIEQAYLHVTSDPRFRYGTRLKGMRLGIEAKRFIVEIYEKLSGRKLLQPE